MELHFGDVSVTEQVIAYQRKSSPTTPSSTLSPRPARAELPTQALWYALPDERAGAALPPDVLLGALHAAEHSQIAVLPPSRRIAGDIMGLSTNIHFQTGLPTIFIYDGHPGGVGIARRGYDEFEPSPMPRGSLWASARVPTVVRSCIQSPKCGENLNEPPTRPARRADGVDHQPHRGRAPAGAGGLSRRPQIAVIGRGASTTTTPRRWLRRSVADWRRRAPWSCAAAFGE